MSYLPQIKSLVRIVFFLAINESKDQLDVLLSNNLVPIVKDYCCCYNPPKASPYRWSETSMIDLDELKTHAEKEICETIILTGDFNHENTCWKTLNSTNDYENKIVGKFSEYNFQEILNHKQMGQLDVFLTNNPNQLINRYTKNEFNKSFNSDHDAFTVKIEAQTEMQSETKQHKFAFNKADRKELNNYILENLFKPYCYSNIDELVKQWYKWLDDVLTKNVPKTTVHRSNFPPG